jgi:pimeloyl-ACP methyl ester carboxylesterase
MRRERRCESSRILRSADSRRACARALFVGLAWTGVVCSARVFADAPDAGRTLAREPIEAAYAASDSRFVTVDEVRLHVRDAGSGPAVLLIHGSLGDTADWDGWLRELGTRYRVVRMDLPGFGLSGPIRNENYSIDRSLSLIDGLMDELGIARFAIAGASYGGPVAFRYAATRTERVTALLLTNSAGIEYGRQSVDPKTGEKSFYSGASSAAAATREFVEKGLRAGFNDPSRIPPGAVERKLAFLNLAGRDREGALMIAQYVRGDPERVLAHVRAPSLVMWGAAQRSLSVATADRFVAALRNAAVVEKYLQPLGDHWMHVEWSAQTGARARAFLDQHVPR